MQINRLCQVYDWLCGNYSHLLHERLDYAINCWLLPAKEEEPEINEMFAETFAGNLLLHKYCKNKIFDGFNLKVLKET